MLTLHGLYGANTHGTTITTTTNFVYLMAIMYATRYLVLIINGARYLVINGAVHGK